MQRAAPKLVLASASSGRAALLRAAGLAFEIYPAEIDEAAVKRAAAADDLPAGETALRLAELKARRVSARVAGALVIGADQILVCNEQQFDKPRDRREAKTHLQALSGRAHHLMTALTCVRDGTCLWRHLEAPALTMRPLSTAFIDAYLDAEGPDVLGSVGVYRIEGIGIQLFAAVEGTQSAIIGLPLLPLLGFLRGYGVLSG